MLSFNDIEGFNTLYIYKDSNTSNVIIQRESILLELVKFTIQIHPMLSFNTYICGATGTGKTIQIHPMLSFNAVFRLSHQFFYFDSNTSNVIIQRIFKEIITRNKEIQIHPMLSFNYIHFVNTFLQICIQIHPMLSFNSHPALCKNQRDVFKYIQCYHSTCRK